MSTTGDWYKVAESALQRSMYGGRLHLATITPSADNESLRLAFKPNEHAPWAIEYFVRPWRGRLPTPDDIDWIARDVDREAATWFERKSKGKKKQFF
jgi:hypothetical protein